MITGDLIERLKTEALISKKWSPQMILRLR